MGFGRAQFSGAVQQPAAAEHGLPLACLGLRSQRSCCPFSQLGLEWVRRGFTLCRFDSWPLFQDNGFLGNSSSFFLMNFFSLPDVFPFIVVCSCRDRAHPHAWLRCSPSLQLWCWHLSSLGWSTWHTHCSYVRAGVWHSGKALVLHV